MKKKIFFTLLLVFIGYLSYQAYVFFIAPNDNLQSIYLVPKDAIYIIETQKPIDNWSEISQSEIWQHLQQNNYFKNLTQNLSKLDLVFTKQKKIIDFIGNRSLLISAHMVKEKQYGLLYIVDLQKLAKLNVLKNHLSNFNNKNYTFTNRQYHNTKITEIFDKKTKETLNIAFIKNQLIASYTHVLVENAIDQYLEPSIGRNLDFIEINKKVSNKDLFRCYLQYNYLNSFVNYFSDKPNAFINLLNNNLMFSGFSFNLKNNNTIFATGYTNTNKNTQNYLKALQKSGKGNRSIANIAPQRTALYLSFGFNSFNEFYKNFENLQKENKAQFKIYQDKIDEIENLLKINIKDNFTSFIANEIALLHMQSNKTYQKENEVALVIKTKNSNDAKKNLDFILKKIKKRTPVKFKKINYKNYEINYLAIKGFFKVFLGNLFDSFDKPYFTIINDYVIFSNHPNTLKNIINDFTTNKTLAKTKDYTNFIKQFDKKSSVFTYINTPTLYNSLLNFTDKNTNKKLKKNKDYIICFPQLGFQLTPFVNIFESKLVINYQDINILKNKDQFKDIKLIGPTQNQQTNTTTITNPIVSTNQDAVFNITEIKLQDLNSNLYQKNYTNGKTHIKVPFKNGMKHGRYKEYYPNGKTRISGKYKKDTQIGTWRFYNADGKLLYKKKFK